MDIEGYEMDVAAGFLNVPRTSKLPYQVLVETHAGTRVQSNGVTYVFEQSDFVFHSNMAKVGYVPVRMEPNPNWKPYVESVWVRAYCDLSDE